MPWRSWTNGRHEESCFPRGRPLDQRLLEELANESRLLLIAGHYEGIDERVVEHLELEEISLGDFVLSGGELGALVLVDGIAQLQPGVLGHSDSARRTPSRRFRRQTSVDCSTFPTTEPRVWEGREVPKCCCRAITTRSHNGGFGKGRTHATAAS